MKFKKTIKTAIPFALFSNILCEGMMTVDCPFPSSLPPSEKGYAEKPLLHRQAGLCYSVSPH